MNGPTIVFLTAIIAVAVSIYFLLKTRHLERMARIEHGMAEPIPHKPYKRSHDYLLTIGLFFCGIGLGLAVGFILESMINSDGSPIIPSCILMCSGGALVLARSIHNKKED